MRRITHEKITTATGTTHAINGAKVERLFLVRREIENPPWISLNQSMPTCSTCVFGKQFGRRINSFTYACLITPHMLLVRRRWIPFLLLLFPHTLMCVVLTVRSLGIHSALLLMHFVRSVFGVRDTWSLEQWATVVRQTLFYVCMQPVVRSTTHVCSSNRYVLMWLYGLRQRICICSRKPILFSCSRWIHEWIVGWGGDRSSVSFWILDKEQRRKQLASTEILKLCFVCFWSTRRSSCTSFVRRNLEINLNSLLSNAHTSARARAHIDTRTSSRINLHTWNAFVDEKNKNRFPSIRRRAFFSFNRVCVVFFFFLVFFLCASKNRIHGDGERKCELNKTKKDR